MVTGLRQAQFATLQQLSAPEGDSPVFSVGACSDGYTLLAEKRDSPP